MIALRLLTLAFALSTLALAASADAAGINTSRSNAKNSGAAAERCAKPTSPLFEPGKRAVDAHLDSRGGLRGQAPNRGYIVGNGGTARQADIGVNEPGVNCAEGSGQPVGKQASVAAGDLGGHGPGAPQPEGGTGRASGQRQ